MSVLLRKLYKRPIKVIFLAALLSASCTDAAEVDSEYAAKLIFEAHQSHEALPNLYRLNPKLNETKLYDIQSHYIKKRLSSGDSIGGFKGGFAPKASVGAVLWGGDAIIQSHSQNIIRLKLSDYQSLIVEAELGFKFCKPINTRLENIEALKAAVCSLHPVMEIADASLENFKNIKKDFQHLRSALIPINVGSAKTLIGESFPPSFDLNTLTVSMNFNKNEIGTQNFSQGNDLWSYVLWVINNYVIANGYTIASEQFIIPGNLTGIHLAREGVYRANFGETNSLSLAVE